jgi:hypothetical protein
LRAKRIEAPGSAKKLVGGEHWPWALKQARALTRHFGDLRAIEGLGDAADFSLSHNAVPLAAEQVLVDIGTFEAESGGRGTKR